ncbi:MAG: hypothetical protein V3U92_16705 [Cellulophaga sp.]
MFAGCSNDTDNNTDATAPKVFIQSPILLLNYSTAIGNSNIPYRVTFKAQGADETKISTLKLIVTNSEGNIVLEKISVNNSDSKSILDIYVQYETTNVGTYSAQFIATDTSGNISSKSVDFTYED